MNNKKIIRDIEAKANKYFKNTSGCHDWSHVERVRTLALKIGRKEKCDLFILELSVLLHDIARKEEIKNKGSFCHAERSAELAREVLSKYNLEEALINEICHCIISHRFRNNFKPESIEAKVLFDADKLDSIGAIGLARSFLFAGNAGSKTLYSGNEKKLAKTNKDYSFTKNDSAYLEYEIKLKKLKDKMLTKEGKRIASGRHKFMEYYYTRFWWEVWGVK